LNGAAVLPPEPPLAPPSNPPQEKASAADLVEGFKQYDTYCVRCHMPNAASPNVVPDLRRSPYLASKEGWQSVVNNGALSARGMIGWNKNLTPEQIEKIRLYVGEQARKLREQEQAKSVN